MDTDFMSLKRVLQIETKMNLGLTFATLFF